MCNNILCSGALTTVALGQTLGGALVARGATGAGGSPAWLTEAGTALLPAADAMLATAGEAARALSDLRAAHSGRVALGASQTVGTYLIPRLLASFRARNPGIEVTLQVGPFKSHLNM